MKNNIALIILEIVCISMISSVFLVSCQSNEKPLLGSGSISDNSIAMDILHIRSSASVDYTIIEETFTDISHKNSSVKIKYPQLNSDKRDYSKTNQLIKDTIHDFLNYDYGDNYTDLTLDVDYQITMKNDALISIVFDGLGNVITAAHPNNILFSVNIDLENSSKVRLQDIYTVDNEFVDTYKENFLQKTATEKSSIIDNYSNDELFELLRESDDFTNGVYSYITDEKLVISFAVPHAIGDHIETEINYQEILSSLKTKDGLFGG